MDVTYFSFCILEDFICYFTEQLLRQHKITEAQIRNSIIHSIQHQITIYRHIKIFFLVWNNNSFGKPTSPNNHNYLKLCSKFFPGVTVDIFTGRQWGLVKLEVNRQMTSTQQSNRNQPMDHSNFFSKILIQDITLRTKIASSKH